MALHWINLTLFLLAATTFGRLLLRLRQIPDGQGRRVTDVLEKNVFRLLLASLCGSGMLLSTLFIWLQLDWILQARNEAVGDVTSMLWLLWDYLMVLFMLICASLGHVLVEWRVSAMRMARRSDHPQAAAQ